MIPVTSSLELCDSGLPTIRRLDYFNPMEPSETISDGELITIYRTNQSRKNEVVGSLVDRYGALLQARVSRYIKLPPDAPDVKDITQQTWLDFFTSGIYRFKFKSSLSTYLTQISMRKTQALWKDRARLAEVPLNPLNEDDDGQPLEHRLILENASHDYSSDLNKHLDNDKLMVFVSDAMSKLELSNPRQHAALKAVYYEGISQSKASEKLGCSPSTLRQRLYGGKIRLRKLLSRISGDSDKRD